MAKRKGEGRQLVIVESPAKAKTINRYLGDDFVVKASMGHVRDLPEHDFGVDLVNGFRPTYEAVRGRSKVLSELKKLAQAAPQVYLATDRDREGEAIAWHLSEALSLDPEKTRRVIFNEITKSAIAEAFKHPHGVDLDRVNAQQARRILDRIVGYELSPLLWRKIAKGLSAGRVQSVAVRLIVDREREIRAFVPEESWKIAAFITGDAGAAGKLAEAWAEFRKGEPTQKDTAEWLRQQGAFRTELAEVGGKPFDAKDADAARAVCEALGYAVERIDRRPWEEYKHLGLQTAEIVGSLRSPAALRISELTTKRTTTRPPGPFTTASLQQQASTYLRFAASRTMRLAQDLYEGVDLHGEGPVGLITYMRTDSTNLSGEALGMARTFIQREFGDRYLPAEPNFFGKRQARAQEAHEAIRPTDPNRTPESLRGNLSGDHLRLYDVIWRRFVACQMSNAEWDSTSVSASCETKLGAARFAGNGRKLVFEGFYKVAGISSEDQMLPELREGQPVGLLDLEPRQSYTSPPPRFTEASLVKTMEAEGIGRPSTYASIIETIQSRGYVEQLDRKFYPSSLGEVVTDRLVEHFPEIMDIKFTSYMEEEFDKIEESHLDWVHVLHEFYDPFKEHLARATDTMDAARSQPSEYKCPACTGDMVYRWSKTGRFLACSKYPECKQTLNCDRDGKPLTVEGVSCELCSKPMVLRQSRNGYFLGCSGYPDCRSTLPCDSSGKPLKVVPEEELARPCDACGEGTMRVKWKGRRAFLGCDKFPTCKNTGSIPEGVDVKRKPGPPPEDAGLACDKCGRAMVIRSGKRGKFIACSGFPKCRNAKPVEKLEALKAAAAANPNPIAAPAGKGARKAVVATKNADGTMGDPPAGFAWTRTGKPVVEVMPAEGELLCPECGNAMEMRRGRFGAFFSCGNYPRCKFVANLRGQAKKQAEESAPARPKPVMTDIPCEACGSMMQVRYTSRGQFLGCSAYPKCKTTKPLPPGFRAPTSELAAAGTP